MSRTWQTKEKILDSLKKKSKTLTDLSRELDLAPSTVSQHLHELLDSGRIMESELSASKKWKYYMVNTAAIEAAEERHSNVMENRLRWGALVAAAIIIGALLFSIYGHAGAISPGTGSSTTAIATLSQSSNLSRISNGTTVFSVSDSPQSYNISHVYVAISSMEVANASGGVRELSLATNEFDLVALDNISQVIANVMLPAGAYNLVILNISNAYATVNGTNESIALPKRTIALNVTFNVSGNTTNWVNMDFNLERSLHLTSGGEAIVMLPAITAAYHSNSTLLVTHQELLSVQNAGPTVSTRHFDMNLQGVMLQNLTEYENASLNLNATTHAITLNSTAVGNGIWTRQRNSIRIFENWTSSQFNITNRAHIGTNTNITGISGSTASIGGGAGGQLTGGMGSGTVSGGIGSAIGGIASGGTGIVRGGDVGRVIGAPV